MTKPKKVSIQEKIDYVRRYEARQEAARLGYHGTKPVPGGHYMHVAPSKPEDFLNEEEKLDLLQISNRTDYLHSIFKDIKDELSKLYRRRQAHYDEIDKRIRRYDQYKLFEDRFPVLPVRHPLHSREEHERNLEKQIDQSKFLQRKLEASLLKSRQTDNVTNI